jgi:hypothetical protein
MLNCDHQQTEEKSMATCYSCGGFKPEGGRCPTCAKIESDQRLAEQQRDNNRELATRNLNAQVEIAIIQNKEAQRKHDELMEMEELRLKESKKQTQILLEQGLTLEEVYQIGFSFEETAAPPLFEREGLEVVLRLNDKGDIVADYENPYVQQKFRHAYRSGVEDRLKQDYSKGPGIEFMAEAAFNNGYTINKLLHLKRDRTSIYFPNNETPRFCLRASNQAEMAMSINEENGSLECVWHEPYDSDVLNQSFKAGVEKFLKECNTLEKNNERLKDLIKEDNLDQLEVEVEDNKYAQGSLWKAIENAIWTGWIGCVAAIPIYFIFTFLGANLLLIDLIKLIGLMSAIVGFVISFVKSEGK